MKISGDPLNRRDTTKPQRRIIAKWESGMSAAEIAEHFGIPLDAVIAAIGRRAKQER
jgi:uncharacterized protein (DUF433 family)